MKQMTILGSTGSVGTSTLSVVRSNPDAFAVKALIAGHNVDVMAQQCIEFRPAYASMADETSARALRTILAEQGVKTEVLSGENAAIELAALDDVDQVMSAIVGAAGLLPTLAAVRAGKQILLANKESLVTCGRIFMDAVRENQSQLLPIDSEHNAIFQSLPESVQQQLGYASLEENGISRIVLTGSGGPFRELPLNHFNDVTPDQACAHPNWSMGRKISVDSATMMNKGLELIEACWLFDARPEQVEVVIHPQSVIHSLVDYVDGSVLAQLGNPDMRTPIAHALAWPKRIDSGVAPLDLFSVARLEFSAPDEQRFPCLRLARQAAEAGNSAPALLNAANEVAVAAFLDRRIRYLEIASIIDEVLNLEPVIAVDELEAVFEVDAKARLLAEKWLGRNGR